jgi:ferredoxin
VRVSEEVAAMRLSGTTIVTLTPPCATACAAGESPREWIQLIRTGSETALLEAWLSIVEANPLPAVLARICYADCERGCCRDHLDAPVSIRALERSVADHALREHWAFPEPAAATGKRVTVVGSGPCGLSAAYQLARAGHEVTLMDAQAHAGGMLRRGITEQRLPKAILDAEIARICALGVLLRTGRTSLRVTDELASADGVVWAAGASMCMAIVQGRTLWSQPVHTDERVTRTATVSIGRGRRAALALNEHLAGAGLTEPGSIDAIDPGDVSFGLYGRRAPLLPRARTAQLDPGASARIFPYPIQDVAAEADRCLSCGRCFGCAACFDACPFGAVDSLPDGRFTILPDQCCDCRACLDECPCGAIREPG